MSVKPFETVRQSDGIGCVKVFQTVGLSEYELVGEGVPNSLSCRIRLSLSRCPKQLDLLNLRLSMKGSKMLRLVETELVGQVVQTVRLAESESVSQAVQNNPSVGMGWCLSK